MHPICKLIKKTIDVHKAVSHKTYADIAKEMGCSTRTIQRKLKDVSNMTANEFVLLSQILNINWREIWVWIEKLEKS